MKDYKVYWDNFFSKIDLKNNDQPVLVKNFISHPEMLVSWEDVNRSLSNYHIHWEIIDRNTPGDKLEIPILYSKWIGNYQQRSFIYEQINKGKTFCINSVDFINPQIQLLLSQIESLFKVSSSGHIFGSKGNSESFYPHYDKSGNFIIQTFGECEWKVYSNMVSLLEIDQLTTPPNLKELNPVIETVLQPGDMLYIPPRFCHSALPNNPRLSLSVPFYQRDYDEIDRNFYIV